MKWKVLLAVVWIALAGAIAALIIFPPDSVLTAEFRHQFFACGSVRATNASPASAEGAFSFCQKMG
jgi:hypothetical protein